MDLRGYDLNLADLSSACIQLRRILKPTREIGEKEVFCMLTQAQLDGAAADPAKLQGSDIVPARSAVSARIHLGAVRPRAVLGSAGLIASVDES